MKSTSLSAAELHQTGINPIWRLTALVVMAAGLAAAKAAEAQTPVFRQRAIQPDTTSVADRVKAIEAIGNSGDQSQIQPLLNRMGSEISRHDIVPVGQDPFIKAIEAVQKLSGTTGPLAEQAGTKLMQVFIMTHGSNHAALQGPELEQLDRRMTALGTAIGAAPATCATEILFVMFSRPAANDPRPQDYVIISNIAGSKPYTVLQNCPKAPDGVQNGPFGGPPPGPPPTIPPANLPPGFKPFKPNIPPQ